MRAIARVSCRTGFQFRKVTDGGRKATVRREHRQREKSRAEVRQLLQEIVK